PTPSVARTFYGSYIDTDGDRVVVGQGTWFGRRSATVFERGPGGWSIVDTLDGGPLSSGTGAPVGISGSTVMIGNLDDDGETGAVYVYEEIGGTFQQAQILRPSVALFESHFGRRLVLKGDRAVIAAPMDPTFHPRGGAVYVFDRIGGVWTETARIEPPSPRPFAFFGLGVDFDDDRIVVGQPGLVTNGSIAWPVHVFREQAGAWSLERTIDPTRLGFGYSVAVEGDRLAIGSYREGLPGVPTGAIFVYDRIAAGWVLAERLTNLSLDESQRAPRFGQRVDFVGSRLLVGTASPELFGSGDAAYVFEPKGGRFELVARVVSPMPNTMYGASVALAGDDIWVGAPGVDDPSLSFGETVGQRYVYRIDAQLSDFCAPPQPNSTGRAGLLSVTGCSELARNDLALIASSLPPGLTTLFVLGDATTVVPNVFGGAGTLCVGGTIGRFAAQTSDAGGRASLSLDLLQLPSPSGPFAATVGDVGYLQAVYRDTAGSSNSTNALSFVVR
ncbi:MAG: hypothetical protein AAF726_15050, partial [Planctomycetota bacterium]